MFFVVSSNCVDKEEWKKWIIFPIYSFQPDWLDIKKKSQGNKPFICNKPQKSKFPKFILLFYPTVTNAQSYTIPKFQKSKVTIIPKVT